VVDEMLAAGKKPTVKDVLTQMDDEGYTPKMVEAVLRKRNVI
jgi:hypothetical protein